jgi:hypothetical protein
MDWTTAGVSFLSAIGGGVVVHFLALSRERASKRRELVTKHLIDIYQTIEKHHLSTDPNPLAQLQKPVADIQLFGSEEQVSLMHKLVNEVVAKNHGDTTDILNNLKHSLRAELGLSPIAHKFFWFRTAPKEEPKSQRKRK